MSWYSKIKSKIEKNDDSPELKRGQVKQILISEIGKALPEFDFLEYRNGCYTFENVQVINGRNVYEHLHITFALKDRNFSCSVASRINKNYLRSNSYNTGLINRHINLIVLKKGTGVIPVEEAYYFHNGRVKTTKKIIEQIVKDFKKFGKTFLQKQANQFKKSDLLKCGFSFVEKLEIDKAELNDQLEKDLNSGGHLISNIKNETYLKLKSELQNVKGIERDTRKNIPKLTYELLEYYANVK
ncbi:MAG: hypothetical protein CMO82_04505 [Winogradskyella sp.]|uniref:Uncharacterized protein n=1 Tax=Winogradskyella poriferorum TaxID=307627 RepID=A0ABU7W1A7_9FLAO|nr:hypothetical protein [Winogradskyella sp.]|tara:strand:- start:76 stop:801 length:726 start_codon:yes stop_codon:yes gene_type:complete